MKVRKTKSVQFLFTGALLFVLFFLAARLVPAQPLDPWGLFSARRFLDMLAALIGIQWLSSLLVKGLGPTIGIPVSGFIGGLISSTAVTATLAKRSRSNAGESIQSGYVIFLSANLAMLLEAFVIVFVGSTDFHARLLLLFAAPALLLSLLLLRHLKSTASISFSSDGPKAAGLLSLLKLGFFIVLILAVSRLLQNFFGNYGLAVLTFLVSLFEIHGSVMANMQLHDSGSIDVSFLGNLLALSIAASTLSKLGLVFLLGSGKLRRKVAGYASLMCATITLSWVIFSWLA